MWLKGNNEFHVSMLHNIKTTKPILNIFYKILIYYRYLTSNQDVTNSLYSESYNNVAVIFASIPDYLDFYTEAEVQQKGNLLS